jgi:hypothetical protein
MHSQSLLPDLKVIESNSIRHTAEIIALEPMMVNAQERVSQVANTASYRHLVVLHTEKYKA